MVEAPSGVSTIEEWETSSDTPLSDDVVGEIRERQVALEEERGAYDCAGEVFDDVVRRAHELTYTMPIGERVVRQFTNDG